MTACTLQTIIVAPLYCFGYGGAYYVFDGKLQFVGERQGSALDPLKPFLKKGFKNPKNF